MRAVTSGRLSRRGFTLVELMVTVSIVSVLATTSLPMYRGCVDVAKMSEGVAGCGTIRTAMRVYKASHEGKYPFLYHADANHIEVIGISAWHLDGKYFAAKDYDITSNAVSYTVTANFRDRMSYALDQDGNEVGTFRTE